MKQSCGIFGRQVKDYVFHLPVFFYFEARAESAFIIRIFFTAVHKNGQALCTKENSRIVLRLGWVFEIRNVYNR